MEAMDPLPPPPPASSGDHRKPKDGDDEPSMESPSSPEEEENLEPPHRNGPASVASVGGDQLDMEAYAGLYKGRTKIMRLFFIANHCHNQAMELEALRMAYDEIRKGESTSLYKDVCERINGRLGPSYTVDQEWVDAVDRRAAQRLDRLESELNGYKVLI